MNKIDKIQNLKIEEIVDCLVNLVTKIGYDDVKKFNNSITAKVKSPLSTDFHQFIVVEEKLSGNVSIESIRDIISSYYQQSLANVIYIVSNSNISKGFISSLDQLVDFTKLNYLDRDKLIELIQESYPEYWKHNDLRLLEYEKQFCLKSAKETDLKRLKIFNDKYQKLLDIFIEPRIFHSYEDKATQTPVRKKIEIDKLLKDNQNQIISGDAGTGKSTLLKKIGERLIEKNADSTIRNIPVFISTTELFECSYRVIDVVEKKLDPFKEEGSDPISDYSITLLVDSIDEFENDKQKAILSDLVEYSLKYSTKYIIGTRNQEKLVSLFEKDGFNTYQIEKFNNDQIKRFISSFFLGEGSKADELLDSLKENRIIERMAITPLTLSLISILYEENNLEIPATIADIYDNFNSLIIGRATVTSRVQFIDISFKERLLSLYALHLLEKIDNTPLDKNQFYDFFLNYYEGKTLPIKKGKLEDVLEYLIEHTGILVIKDDKWVKFSHDSYMEYYAALEIFKHQREKEDSLINNFFNHNWQNSAIFYAGKSKDLPKFLEKIIQKVKSANSLDEYYMGILGVGYLLQALYQTDNILRKTAVLEALNLSIKTNEITTKLAADNANLFKNYKLPILQLINMMYFYENFNSLTVKQPLNLAFDDVLEEYTELKNSVAGYKAIKLAFLLDSKRINDSQALERLIEEKELFKNPTLYLLMDFGFEFLNKDKYKKLKDSIKKDYYQRIKQPIQQLIKLPASKLRFTSLDMLNSEKRIRIIVEGKTDAEIIEHAYYCLTHGDSPYWSINSAGNESGGAHEVSKALLAAKPIKDKSDIVIGIYDHDSKGLQEFRGLKLFNLVTKDIQKKHPNSDIYAVMLPIPGELDFFLQQEQEFNFFEIEHYFDKSILEAQGIIEECAIPNIYKISDRKKKGFSKYIREQSDPNIFKGFIELFKIIDCICNNQVEYEE